jgi:hypothetical protein
VAQRAAITDVNHRNGGEALQQNCVLSAGAYLSREYVKD